MSVLTAGKKGVLSKSKDGSMKDCKFCIFGLEILQIIE